MKRLRPQDIIANNSYVGHRRDSVIAMAEHYGFRRTNEGKDSKHLVFVHTDYRDLRFTLRSEGGQLPLEYVRSVVEVCMEVKRRNALRKEPVFSEIPEWVFHALPTGTRIANKDNRIAFESGAVLDLDATEVPPVRHYILEMRDNTIHIRSTDYPLEEYSLTFNVKDGSANIGGFKVMFDRLDAQVLAHCDAVARRFNDDLKRLIENHGYEIHEEQRDYARPNWVMSHPLYGTQVHFPIPKSGEAIADETLEKLDTLLEESRDACMNQIDFIEQLRKNGWEVTDHPAIGSAPHLNFKHVSGQSFDVPVYGVNKTFDLSAANTQVEAIIHPVSDGQASDKSTKPSKPVLETAIIDGKK